MAVLFRPVLSVDEEHWIPALAKAFSAHDFRVWPDIGKVEEIDYLITWRLFDGDADAYPNLKAVLTLGAGVNQYIGNPNFPKNAALVRMIDTGLDQGMLEYVLSYVLRLHLGHDDIPASNPGNWDGVIIKHANQRKVGILGLGHLGQICARQLLNVGFQVRGWSKSKKDIPGVTAFAGEEELPAFLKETEILVCLLPSTKETANILKRETLGQLPKGASVINVGRGPLVVDEDLVALLDSGHLHRAVLDVFRKEPLPDDHAFWKNSKILITPHIAAITSPQTGAQKLLQNIEAMKRGDAPDGLVDPKRGY